VQLQPAAHDGGIASHFRGWTIFSIAHDGRFEHIGTMDAQLMCAPSHGLQQQQRAAAASMQQFPLGHGALCSNSCSIIIRIIVFATATTGWAGYHSFATAVTACTVTGNSFVHFADNYPICVCGSR
jgi:hypothetical protein